MKAALTALGFPGEAALDSVAYQVMGALGEALGSFSALAPAAGKLGGQAAVRLLESVARTAAFQPQRDPSARLDVLGLLEAEGGYWDGVWVLGLTDDVLPASPKPIRCCRWRCCARRARRATPNANANGPKACMRRCAAARRDHCQPCAHGRRARTAPVAADRGRRAAGLDARPAGGGRPQESLDDRQGPPLAPGGRGGGGLDVLDTQARNPCGPSCATASAARDGGLCRRGRHQRARTVPASRAGTGLGHAA